MRFAVAATEPGSFKEHLDCRDSLGRLFQYVKRVYFVTITSSYAGPQYTNRCIFNQSSKHCLSEYCLNRPLKYPSVTLLFFLSLLASSRVKPVIYPTVFPLEKVSEGLMAIEQRKTWGKVVVRVRDGDRSQKAKL